MKTHLFKYIENLLTNNNLEEKGPFKFVDICIWSQILDLFCDDELQLAMNPVESDIETYLVKEETYLVIE